MSKIIIAGGRDFNNRFLLAASICDVLKELEEINPTIISGDARGADTLGAKYAYDNGWPVEHYPADWDRWGKSAGYRRNYDMAKEADALVAFWDGKSRGTKHMIEIMEKLNKPVWIIYYG